MRCKLCVGGVSGIAFAVTAGRQESVFWHGGWLVCYSSFVLWYSLVSERPNIFLLTSNSSRANGSITLWGPRPSRSHFSGFLLNMFFPGVFFPFGWKFEMPDAAESSRDT